MIMSTGAMKDLFLLVLKEAMKKYDFRIENLCILDNHFHMIIHPGIGQSLSSIMQWVLGVFAMRFNRILGLTGHVWGERFSSRIINSVMEYIRLFSYIDDNPRRAGLVLRAEDWPYGRFALHSRGWIGLIASPVFGLDSS
jgi:putative transposase